MNTYITVINNIKKGEMMKCYSVGKEVNADIDYQCESGSLVYFYFKYDKDPGIYAIGRVTKCYEVDRGLFLTYAEVIRAEDYPIVKKENLNIDDRFYYGRKISDSESKRIESLIGDWETYAEYNMYSLEQVANVVGVSYNTINNWYAFKKKNPDSEYAKMLPKFYQLSKRQKRYWAKEDAKDLILFKNSIPKGRNGILGDVTQKYLKKRKINGDIRYIYDIESDLKRRNVNTEVIDGVVKALVNEARMRGLKV